jgi:hypothetical protein
MTRRRVLVRKPGFYDLDEDTYHRDDALTKRLGRSLSASGAKTLLKSPARFEYERRHPKASTESMDVGSVAHHLILHRGGRLVVVDAYDWRKPANQQLRDNGRAQGVVVVHRGQLRAAAAMARAVRRHELAGAILSQGKPEQSAYWIDKATGVTLRARIDWLRDDAIVDVKTTADASPEAFAKSCANYGYRESAAHYRAAVHALTGRWLPFVLIAVETAPPHLVAVYRFDADDLAWGAARMRTAIDAYAEHESAGVWPGYSPEIEVLSMPRWAS